MLCDNLEAWDGMRGGREFQEGGNICIPMNMYMVYVYQFILIEG